VNIEQTGQILDVLSTAYPRLYPSKTDRDKALVLWAKLFLDDPVELVSAAVKALIVSDEKGFPPHIGAVKQQMHKLLHSNEMDATDAWNLVRKAIRNSAYEAREEFGKLPEVVQRIVGSPSQLKDWGMMDSDTVHSVVASNFMRAFRQRSESARQFELLPADVKTAISGFAERLTLDAPQRQEEEAL